MDAIQAMTLTDVIDSEEHAELVNGTVVIENKTTVSHNIAISEIVGALRKYISDNSGTCKVFSENVALYVNEICNDNKNYFLPDVMVVCESDGIKEDGVHVAPLFVAEITSEATKKNDYHEKMEIYRRIGVQEYWIVDIQRNVVFKYLSKEDYIPQFFIYPESMKVSVYPNLMIDFSEIMRK